MNKIVVTGANGYIGTHVVRLLLDLYGPEQIIAVDRNNNRIDSRARFIKIDLLENASDPSLYEKLGSPEIIIHLAWKDGFNHKSNSHIEGIPLHYYFLKNMIDSGCKSLSVMGTMHEIGYIEGEVNGDTPCNPMSPYGIAKNALRQLILTYSEGKLLSLKWLRAFYVTGDDATNQSIFSKILNAANEGTKTFPFTSGENMYDFEDVSDLAKQIVFASTQNKISGIINCCSGTAVSLKEKVESFINDHQLDIKLEYGKYPTRKYDSPAIYGNVTLINEIMHNHSISNIGENN